MNDIPEVFKRDGYKFVLEKDKKPIERNWNKTNNYKYNDIQLINWINNNGDVALLIPNNIIVIDLDIAKFDEKYTDKILSELPKTLTIKSKNNGIHLYYKLKNAKVSAVSIKDKNRIYNINKEEELINVRVSGLKITIPPTEGYKVIVDRDIASLSKDELTNFISKYYNEFENKVDDLSFEKKRADSKYYKDLINETIKYFLQQLKEKNIEHKVINNRIHINCPFHNDGKNFDFVISIKEVDGKIYLRGFDNHETGSKKIYTIYEVMKALDIEVPQFLKKLKNDEYSIQHNKTIIRMDIDKGIYTISDDLVETKYTNIFIKSGIKTHLKLDNTNIFKLNVIDVLNGKEYILNGSLSEIVKQIKERFYTTTKRAIEDIINVVLYHLEEKGKIITEERLTTGWGWFYDKQQNKIVGVDIEEHLDLFKNEISKDDLKESLETLYELMNKVYKSESLKVKMWNLLYYAFMSPLSFVSKQLNKPIKSFVMVFGPSGTGKTTFNIICKNMLSLPTSSEYITGGDSIATAYQFGRHLSMNTYPLFVDEVGNFLNKNKFGTFKEMIKTAGESITSIRSRKGNEPVALRVVFATSNFGIEYIDMSSMYRMALVKTDVLSQRTIQERSETSQEIEYKKDVLSKIHSYFVKNYLLNDEENQKLLEKLGKEDLNFIGYEYLCKLFKQAGYTDELINKLLPKPFDLNNIDDLEQKDEFELIIETLRDKLLEYVSRHLITDEKRDKSLREQLIILLNKINVFNGLYVLKNKIMITYDIADEVYKRKGYELESGFLSKIAREYNIDYNSRKINKKSVKGLIMPRNVFLNYILSEYDDEKSDDNSQDENYHQGSSGSSDENYHQAGGITTSEVVGLVVKKSEARDKIPPIPPDFEKYVIKNEKNKNYSSFNKYIFSGGIGGIGGNNNNFDNSKINNNNNNYHQTPPKLPQLPPRVLRVTNQNIKKIILNFYLCSVLENIPSVVGPDGVCYGPFYKGESVILPDRLAKVLNESKKIKIECEIKNPSFNEEQVSIWIENTIQKYKYKYKDGFTKADLINELPEYLHKYIDSAIDKMISRHIIFKIEGGIYQFL